MPKEKKERRFFMVKIVNLITGLLIIGASIWILLDDSSAIDFFILLIAISLAIVGIGRIFVGIGQEEMKTSVRFVKIASGFIALGIGLAVSIIDFLFPSVSIAWLISLSSIALLTIGLSRFFRGIQAKMYPLWYRLLILVAGIASIVISILIILTNFEVVSIISDEYTQVIILAYTLILLGVARISLVFVKKPENLKK